MIPVEEMVLPDKVTDLPVQGLKQFDGERTDRLIMTSLSNKPKRSNRSCVRRRQIMK